MIDWRAIPHEFFWLFGCLVVLLGIASTVATILARRPADAKKAASRANLVERINAWWVMVAILAVAFLLGSTMTLILFALASFFALREFITLTATAASRKSDSRHSSPARTATGLCKRSRKSRTCWSSRCGS